MSTSVSTSRRCPPRRRLTQSPAEVIPASDFDDPNLAGDAEYLGQCPSSVAHDVPR